MKTVLSVCLCFSVLAIVLSSPTAKNVNEIRGDVEESPVAEVQKPQGNPATSDKTDMTEAEDTAEDDTDEDDLEEDDTDEDLASDSVQEDDSSDDDEDDSSDESERKLQVR